MPILIKGEGSPLTAVQFAIYQEAPCPGQKGIRLFLKQIIYFICSLNVTTKHFVIVFLSANVYSDCIGASYPQDHHNNPQPV